ncbi:nucleoside recognition domain-containing protein [Nitrosomonas communis]|uniref:Ferrous iron transport protein B n=1 Tax=Nitrosomonas communis TaxID=44574 RepID=A0A1I4UJN2_9PROT|nr:nucleoside recognition domain-containing protein [Nitrosomonas communis]SFM89197.1 ferrous iron transport protein B [Nitrosomonas communis]
MSKGKSVDQPSFDLTGSLREAFATIPANLGDALGSWVDSPERDGGDIGDQTAGAEERALSTASTFGVMASRFEGAAGAFAYLLFILLYMPCAGAIAAVYQEARARWTVFVACWTTGLGYGVSTLYYQSATWNLHPTTSFAWIAGILLAFGAVLIAMRWVGHSAPHPGLQRNSVGGKVS